MAGYTILGKFRQGVPDMSNMDKNISELKAGVDKMGVCIVGMWGLMGRFDMLMVVDAPNEMSAVGAAAVAGKVLNASTETARAFSEEEMVALGKQMTG